MIPHGKELSEDLKRRIVALHEDGQGYKKIANTLKLSCSTAAKIIQRFQRVGSTQNRPQVGRPKKLSARAERQIQMLSLKDQHRSAVSIAAVIEEVGGQPVSAQTIRRTLHQIGVHVCHPRRKPLLKTIHKKAHKQFAEDMSTKYINYWNYALWSDEMKINLFGSDGFKHVWRRPGEEYKDKCVMPTFKHGGGNIMVWGCMSAAGVGELHFMKGNMNSSMYCETLQQSMIPSLQKLGHRAVFQHDNDPKHTSKMTTTLLKRLKVRVMDWPSMSPDLNPIEYLWGCLNIYIYIYIHMHTQKWALNCKNYHTTASCIVFLNIIASCLHYCFTDSWHSFQLYLKRNRWQIFLMIFQALTKLNLNFSVFYSNSQIQFNTN